MQSRQQGQCKQKCVDIILPACETFAAALKSGQTPEELLLLYKAFTADQQQVKIPRCGHHNTLHNSTRIVINSSCKTTYHCSTAAPLNDCTEGTSKRKAARQQHHLQLHQPSTLRRLPANQYRMNRKTLLLLTASQPSRSPKPCRLSGCGMLSPCHKRAQQYRASAAVICAFLAADYTPVQPQQQ